MARRAPRPCPPEVVKPAPPPAPPEPTQEPAPGLPDKPTYRISEVADYFDVTERTIRLWIDHGHLSIVYTGPGVRRVTRESLNLCRFRPKSLRSGPF